VKADERHRAFMAVKIMIQILRWFIISDAAAAIRACVGVGILAVFALVDWRKHRANATKWRECGVLAIAVLAAMLYGTLNDQVTSSISWEYFYYGKELDNVLGPTVPPATAPLHWEVAKVGMKATWSVGLLIGVALLLANNPWRDLPRLAYRELVKMLPLIVGSAVVLGVIGGFAGYHGWLTHFAADFEDMWRADIFRPRRFLCTWGVHLGGYLGGLTGTLVATAIVLRDRRRRRV